MTYCIGMRLDAGLVFLSDSRTNAGVDHVGTARKMTVFENPGDRVMVMLTAGNLSISQAVLERISAYAGPDGGTIWNAPNMYEAARALGAAVRTVHQRDAASLQQFGIDFNINIIFGGQILGEQCRLFQIYAAGNFIESHTENLYFQIGESKYGKPIIDRLINPSTGLDEAAKCALVSMDSTLRSNISVGLPLDLLVYEEGSHAVTRFVTIDDRNPYFTMIRNTWGQQLRTVFEGIDDPVWDAPSGEVENVLSSTGTRSVPMRAIAPKHIHAVPVRTPLQSLAECPDDPQP
jgi:putative proteasome-type protease